MFYPLVPKNYKPSAISNLCGFVTRFSVAFSCSLGNKKEFKGYCGKYALEKSYEPGITSVSSLFMKDFIQSSNRS